MGIQKKFRKKVNIAIKKMLFMNIENHFITPKNNCMRNFKQAHKSKNEDMRNKNIKINIIIMNNIIKNASVARGRLIYINIYKQV